MTDRAAEPLAALAAGMGSPEHAALAAAAAAFAALAAVMYKEFLQRPRLHATLDRISLLRMPAAARDPIVHEALIDDILSPAPSLRAQEIANGSRETRAAVPTGDRKKISAALLERIQKQGHIDYCPPPEFVEAHFRDRRFFNHFYAPIIVFNAGRKMVHVSSLVLIARARKSGEAWAFTAYLTLDPLKILDWSNQSDLARIGGQFIGASIEPFGSIQMHPWFIPVAEPPHRKLAQGGMPPGDYEMRVTGYGSGGKRLFSTGWTRYTLTRELLLDAFAGKDSIGNLLVDEHIAEAVKDI